MFRSPLRWLLALACSLVFCGLVLYLMSVPRAPWHSQVWYGACLLTPWVTFAWVGAAQRQIRFARFRHDWRFIGLSALPLSLWALLCLVWPLAWKHLPPVAWRNLLLLVGALLCWTGLLLRPGAYARYLSSRVLLLADVMLVLAAGAVILQRLAPAQMPPSGHWSLALEFPAIVLLTLCAVVVLLHRSLVRPLYGPVGLLLAALLLVAAGQAGLAWAALTGQPLSPTLGVVWLGGYLLYGTAALWELSIGESDQAQIANDGAMAALTGLIVPGLTLTTAVYLLLRTNPTADPAAARSALFALAILLGLAVIRQTLAYAVSRHLHAVLSGRYTEMEHTAATDRLTGLPNNRSFMDRLEKEMSRAARYHRSFSLIFTDIDFFKLINDAHGHRVGDKALAAVADCLAKRVRDTDMIARYGGEEFVFLLPETTLSQAGILAERLRTAVETMNFTLPNGFAHRITISCGISAYPETSDSVEGLITDADQAMNRAKEAGRNRVLTATARQHLFIPD